MTRRRRRDAPAIGDFLTDAQAEQFAELLVRPYTLLDEADIPRPER